MVAERCEKTVVARKQSPMQIQILVEGVAAERRMERAENIQEAMILVKGMPRDKNGRMIYVRNVVIATLRDKIPLPVFKLFAQKANVWEEIAMVGPRAKLLFKASKNPRRLW